jgi:hypothetical protein
MALTFALNLEGQGLRLLHFFDHLRKRELALPAGPSQNHHNGDNRRTRQNHCRYSWKHGSAP